MKHSRQYLKLGAATLFVVIFLVVAGLVAVLVPSGKVNAAACESGDCPSEQANADRSATTSGGNINKALQSCLKRVGTDTYYETSCVVSRCKAYDTIQYQDACFKKGFNLTSCDPRVTATYQACYMILASRCQPLPTEPQLYCSRALTWYISGYHTENPTTKTHAQAFNERVALLQGGTLNPDGSITPPGGGESVFPEFDGGVADDPSTEEDEGLTADEIRQQAEELREKLAADDTSECGGVEGKSTSTVFDFECSDVSADDCEGIGDAEEKRLCLQRVNPIMQLIFTITRVFTYGVGIIITLAIVISGIQYTAAQGDAGTVKKARNRIFNAVVALLLYIFAFAILNYLVPGGLIG